MWAGISGFPEIRGKGLMVGMELVENQETREPASAEAAEIRAGLSHKWEQGY
jgi:4-aminobutyrate aminotransferase-like enzyme